MKNLSIVLFSLFVFLGNGRAQSFIDKKLPIDLSVRVGQLENGITYYIKHHQEPKGRGDFFIVHNVGALQEEDNQNGLAHFLEHMAFNGSTHFPDNGMLDYTASIGVRFGYNVNAYTSRDRTVYNVSNVPLVRESIVDSLLLIMHDWSGFLALAPDKIEKERGVIREEWRQGSDSRNRMNDKQMQLEYAGSKFAERDVIGNPEIIRTFERQTLVDFYQKWYRPNLQAVIVVGDVDVDVIESKIKKLFSTIPKPINPTPKEVYTLDDSPNPVIATVSDPETKVFGVKILFRHPYPSPKERLMESFIRNDLRRAIFLEMIKDRFTTIEKSDTASWRRAVAVTSNLNVLRRTLMITLIPQKDSNLIRSLRGVEVEVERIRRFGFSESNFLEAKAKVANSQERVVEQLRQINNTQMVTRYIDHFTREMPYMTIQDQIAITQQLLMEIDYEDVSDMASLMLNHDTHFIIFNVPDQAIERVPSNETVLEMLHSVQSGYIHPFETESPKEVILLPNSHDLTPGSVVQTNRVVEFDAEEWTLSNGLRVIWKELASTNGWPEVSLRATNTGGYNRNTDYAGLHLLNNYIRSGASIGDIDKEELRAALAPLRLSLTPFLNKEESGYNGSAWAKDFESLLQLVYRYMTDPNFLASYYQKTMDRIREDIEKPKTEVGIYQDSLERVKYNNHPWLTEGKSSDLLNYDYNRLQTLYHQQFGNPADFTFYIAGSLPTLQAKTLVEKYLGSLTGFKPEIITNQTFEIADGVREIRFQGKSAITPKATISRVYHGDLTLDAKNNATLNYLSYILSERYLKSIREEEGGTYYISARSSVREFPFQKCYLTINFTTNPQMAEMLLDAVESGIAELAKTGPTLQEVTQAKLYFQKQHLERNEKDTKSPGVWIGRMRTFDRIGINLKTDDPEIFSSVTPQEVQQLCQSIYTQGNCFTTQYIQE